MAKCKFCGKEIEWEKKEIWIPIDPDTKKIHYLTCEGLKIKRKKRSRSLPSVKDLVKKLLEEDPRCREDDVWLIWRFWNEFDGVNIPLKVVARVTNPETIRRSRQYIQNTLGLFRPDEKVQEGREIKEEEYREYFSSRKNKDYW